MILIREFMLILLLTTITGSLLMLVWLTVVKAGMGKRNVHYVWWMLKGVLAGYLIPFIYLLFHWCSEMIRDSYDILSVSNVQMDQVFLVLFLIWMAGVLVMLFSQLHTWICFRRIQKSSMPAPIESVQILQELRTELNLRKPVALYQGYGVVSPFIFGIRRPRIYLPVQDFSREELEIILYHELTHYRQGDTFWKLLFGILGNIYWFSPFSRYLWHQAVRWAEANCDAYCCQDRFQTKQYFLLLLKMDGVERNRLNGYVPMWSEGSRELEWRILCMKRNHRKKPRGIVIVAIIMAFILGGGGSAYAAAEGVRQVYYGVYESTVEKREIPPDSRNKLKEHEGFIEDYAEMNFIQHEEISSIDTASGTIDWIVGHNAMRCTGEFPVSAGRKIRVRLDLGSGNRTVKAGIMRPDGKISYVSGKHSISHTFNVSQTGNYKVFVSNSSGKAVTVRGSYVRPIFSMISKVSGSQNGGRFYDATVEEPVLIEIKNDSENNQIFVTCTMMLDSNDMAGKMDICKDSEGKMVVASTTFHRTQPHSAEFILPAGQTYYAKITPIGTQSVSGNFMAEH